MTIRRLKSPRLGAIGFRLLASIALAGLVIACASAPPEGPSLEQEAITLEQRAVRAAQSQNFINADNLAAESLDLYTVLDNAPGQVRLLTLRSRLAVQGGLKKRATRFLQKARELTPKTDLSARYELALLAGHIADDPQKEYELALRLADTELRQAVALTYLGRPQQARPLVTELEPDTRRDIDDLGFVLYEHARVLRHREDAERALEHYKQAENILGISDVLFLLGELSAAQQDLASARDYYARALAVNQRLGDQHRIAISKQALRSLPSTATP